MKLKKIDHIGIAVPSMADGRTFWSEILGLGCAGEETVAAQKVTTGFFPVGEREVELLESTDPDGPVARFIARNGPGMQHIAFEVDDIEAALAELSARGVRLIDQQPRMGAGNKKIAFLHPKSTGGVLVELCQPLD